MMEAEAEIAHLRARQNEIHTARWMLDLEEQGIMRKVGELIAIGNIQTVKIITDPV